MGGLRDVHGQEIADAEWRPSPHAPARPNTATRDDEARRKIARRPSQFGLSAHGSVLEPGRRAARPGAASTFTNIERLGEIAIAPDAVRREVCARRRHPRSDRDGNPTELTVLPERSSTLSPDMSGKWRSRKDERRNAPRAPFGLPLLRSAQQQLNAGPPLQHALHQAHVDWLSSM